MVGVATHFHEHDLAYHKGLKNHASKEVESILKVEEH
jgi:hypothetical protein